MSDATEDAMNAHADCVREVNALLAERDKLRADLDAARRDNERLREDLKRIALWTHDEQRSAQIAREALAATPSVPVIEASVPDDRIGPLMPRSEYHALLAEVGVLLDKVEYVLGWSASPTADGKQIIA